MSCDGNDELEHGDVCIEGGDVEQHRLYRSLAMLRQQLHQTAKTSKPSAITHSVIIERNHQATTFSQTAGLWRTALQHTGNPRLMQNAAFRVSDPKAPRNRQKRNAMLFQGCVPAGTARVYPGFGLGFRAAGLNGPCVSA